MSTGLACLLALATPGPAVADSATATRPAEPDRAAVNAEAAARDAFEIDRARAALAAADPRRAMVAAVVFEAGRQRASRAQVDAEPAAPAPTAELARLAGEAVALAQARGADDVVAQLLLAQVCDRPWARCDVGRALTRLAELEPGNGLAALLALARVRDAEDPEGERAALMALAGAERLDTHDVDLLAAARDFVGDRDVPDAMVGEGGADLAAADRRAVAAFGYWLAIPRPGLIASALAGRCRGTPEDRCRCVAAARVLAGADDAISPRIGLALLADLVEDPAEHARIRARQRDLDWQMAAFGELTRDLGESPGPLAAQLDAQIAAGGEMALQAKLLSEAGIPLTAPAGWVPSDPRLRD